MLTKKRGRHCDRCKVDLTARPTTVNGRARVRMPPHVVVTVTRHGTTGLGDHPTVSVRPIHLCVPCSPVVAALEDLLRGGEPK